ncbi:ABC transporter ATP-binding protein [Amycolatopsis saalfeldensis]|uniref:Peptide/nickel transport system ATP-binding protein n=1 Tax=Amycolatopsis saalfeldensis TaxID=394193 RepID=A0A1H8R2Z4_9PSEU|nr:ABC transporter ATP-binding protein [Amycolatopsis saalfeldensis]SEO61029.1 peptide/nickel transport system ATP-binding protein [Amycolatopsis saalfeldensis]
MSEYDSQAGSGDPVLVVEDLTVQFPTGEGLVKAVRGVNYQLRRGEVLGIVGESGSGKSVTSLAVMGLLPRTAQVTGSIRFGGVELLKSSEKELNKVRGKGISMVFQDPMTSLNPVYTVGDQIAEAITAHNDIRKDVARKQAVELLELVRIPNPAQRANEYPHQLSGGMRQRVVIAIAMANNPDVIIADEPTTALDVTVQAQILEALRAAQQETGAAMVLITHDLGVIAGAADRVHVMYAGKVVESGTVDEIFYTPRMPYTLGLLGSLPRLDVKTERLTPITGAPPATTNMPPGCPFSPRCPLSQPICDEEEPPLVAGPGAQHAACHFTDQVVGRDPAELFSATSADTAAVPVAVEATASDTETNS